MEAVSLSTLLGSLPITIGGERLALRSITIGELPAAERVMAAWLRMVETAGVDLDTEAQEEFLDMVAASVGKDRPWLDALTPSEQERLVCHMLAVNQDVWDRTVQGDGRDQEPIRWPDVVQELVEHGHRASDVAGYTLPRARAFLVECYRRDRENLGNQVLAASYAMAKPEDTQRAVRALHEQH